MSTEPTAQESQPELPPGFEAGQIFDPKTGWIDVAVPLAPNPKYSRLVNLLIEHGSPTPPSTDVHGKGVCLVLLLDQDYGRGWEGDCPWNVEFWCVIQTEDGKKFWCSMDWAGSYYGLLDEEEEEHPTTINMTGFIEDKDVPFRWLRMK
jgi:hypothetical protein